MTETKLSRAERQRMRRLTKLLDRITSADCRFLNARRRQYRVRLATEAEIEQLELVEGPLGMPLGRRTFTVIKQVSFNSVVRTYVANDGDILTDDWSDAECRKVFETVAPEYTPEVEKNLRIIAEMMSYVSSTVPASSGHSHVFLKLSGHLSAFPAPAPWPPETGAREKVRIDWATFPPTSNKEVGTR